jgi:hypothetical protein
MLVHMAPDVTLYAAGAHFTIATAPDEPLRVPGEGHGHCVST